MIAPSFGVIAWFVYGFIFWTIYISFTKSKLLPKYEFWGIDQYFRLWSMPRWHVAVENLFIFTVLFIILCVAVSERFIEAGAKVIIWDIDEEAIKKAIDKVSSENLTYQIVDVSDFENINNSLKEIENKHGKIDIFINNAGIAGMNTTVAEYPLDEWKKVINLNLNSVFYCCKAVVPFMEKNNYGRIVNIASIAGKEGNPNASAYSTSKAGVIGLTKSLGKELAQKNIAVNCVTPAAAKTRIFDQMTEEHINYMLSKIPRNKFAKVEELASLVTWLSSEENSFSTAAEVLMILNYL